jgi:hypothetical protein
MTRSRGTDATALPGWIKPQLTKCPNVSVKLG